MKLLALDLATRIGWAAGDTEAGDPVSGFYDLTSGDGDTQMFFLSFGVWLRDMIEAHKPALIYMEAPMRASTMVNTATVYKLWGLCANCELIGGGRQIPVREVAAGTWKASFTGNGKFGKKTKPYPPLVRCRELGWKVKDDNEADALGIFVHGVSVVDPAKALRFDPLFRVDQTTSKAA